jgi:hypothetical protein
MDSIRREIISPVRQELERSAKLGRFSVWGFWVGLIGGVLAIFSIALALVQWLGSNPQMISQSKDSQVQSIDAAEIHKIRNLEVPNPPKRFTTQKGIVAPGEKEWILFQQDTLIQQAGAEKIGEFKFSDRVVNGKCIGSLFYMTYGTLPDKSYELFIPDNDCPTMNLMVRQKKGEWTIVGQMQNIQ